MNLTSRELRLLTLLSERARVSIKDLRTLVGALNVAQVALTLRRKGWAIQTGYFDVIDRDGKKCRPGYYWLEDSEKEKAQEFLRKMDGAAATAPQTDNSEHNDSNNNFIEGEKNDKLL